MESSNSRSIKISLFESNKNTKPIDTLDLYGYLEDIRNGEWATLVNQYRTTGDESYKTSLGRVTFSGMFKTRKTDQLLKHSDVLCIDIDPKDNQGIDMQQLKEILSELPTVLAVWFSCSGKGLTVLFKIYGKRHREAFEAIWDYLADEYFVQADRQYVSVASTKNHSFDPDLYLNKNAKRWDKYIEKKNIYKKPINIVSTDEDLRYILNQIEEQSIDITPIYSNWLKVGQCIKERYGDAGLEVFKRVSRIDKNYSEEEATYKYQSFGKNPNSELTYDWFIWHCKRCGVDVRTQITNHIISITNVRLKSIGKSGGCVDAREAKKVAKQFLIDTENIDASYIDDVQKQIKGEIKQEKIDGNEDQLIIEHYFVEEGAKKNIITQMVELEKSNIILTEDEVNTIYFDLNAERSDSLKKSDIKNYITSSKVLKYNPILDYMRSLPTGVQGYVDQVLDCINAEDDKAYVRFAVCRYLLSIVGSAFGNPSSMMLALVSQKHGTGKTAFFSKILPKDLDTYRYMCSNPIFNKDLEANLASHLLFVFDDISLRKDDYDKFKSFSSKNLIQVRLPYKERTETFKRYAVFGATCNKIGIIQEESNRRIMPINVKKIDIDALEKIDMRFVWAEVTEEYLKLSPEGKRGDLTPAEISYLKENTSRNMQYSLEKDLIQTRVRLAEEGSGIELSRILEEIGWKGAGGGIDLNTFVDYLRFFGYKEVQGNKWNCQVVRDFSNIIN